MRILFVLKQAISSGGNYSESGSSKSGLLNSAKFVANALDHFLHIKSNIEVVVDGNSIDKYIHLHKPDVVVIEALWVTPAKLDELSGLYPSTIFVIRIHSKTPFLSTEGIAVQWIVEYQELHDQGKHVYAGFNAKETYDEFVGMGIANACYLPNFYFPEIGLPYKECDHEAFTDPSNLNIACFGATRPLKNQLIQAVAAIEYATKQKRKLYFHINGNRLEQGGDSCLKNIRSLFKHSHHQLVEWNWMDHPSFLHLMSKMHVCLQVSLSESFCIVAADAVFQGVPVVVSKDVDWLPSIDKVCPNSSGDIMDKIHMVLRWRKYIIRLNKRYLFKYNIKSLVTWKRFLNE